jgi:hypothetical protein
MNKRLCSKIRREIEQKELALNTWKPEKEQLLVEINIWERNFHNISTQHDKFVKMSEHMSEELMQEMDVWK